MKISNEQVHCLNAICDDYEKIINITDEVVSETGKDLSFAQVESFLDKLVEMGLVNKYFYDTNDQSYVVDTPNSKPSASYWFYITDKGRDVLEENWQK